MSFARLTELELTALLERGLEGDQAAYRKFLYGISEVLREYLQRHVDCIEKTSCEVEDLLQEALLAIHSKRHVYETGIPVITWALAIGRHGMLDFLRTIKIKDEASNISLQEAEDVTGIDETKMELALAVKLLLATLPEKLRRPIELMKLRGFSVRETAAMTRTSETSVKVSVHRGLKILARALK